MSSRVNGRALKNYLAIAGVLCGAVALSGCSSLGSIASLGSNVDTSLTTGSIASSGAGDPSQPLPGTLSSSVPGVSPSTSGPYLPPVNVGATGGAENLITGSLPLAPSLNSSTNVIAQDLPVLPQTNNVGSQQAMPAQSVVTPLFQDNPVPVVAAPRSTPDLSVVAQGVFQHTIETGESLYTIARRYDVTTDAIVRANDLSAPDQIYVGQKVIIPGRTDLLASTTSRNSTPAPDNITTASVVPTQSQATAPAPTAVPRQIAATSPVAIAADGFRWPVTGRVIVDFEDSRRTGINIEAPEGAAVRAAEGGSVIYVGSGVEGYGNLILVRHASGYVSAYAHLKDITIAKNDAVRRGDPIGTIGMTGSVNRPQLHFELRQGATPVDPMPLLAN